MAERLQAVLFDWDGVIADSENLTVLGEKEAALRYAGNNGLEFDAEKHDWTEFKGWGRAMIGKALFDLDDEAADDFRELAADTTAELVCEENLKPITGALGFVGWIKGRGIPMGVATSSNSKIYKPSVELFGLDDDMRVAVCHGEALDNKPLQGPYRKAMNYLGVERHKTLIMEDSRSGIEAGVAAGGIVIALATTQTPEYLKANTRAHFIARDYNHAAYFVDRLLA